MERKYTTPDEKIKAFKENRVIDVIEWSFIDLIQPLTYPKPQPFKITQETKVMQNEFYALRQSCFICFADRTMNKSFEKYIIDHQDNINKSLKGLGFTFLMNTDDFSDIDVSILKFYFPFENWDNQKIRMESFISLQDSIGNTILDLYQYEGLIKTGIIEIKNNKVEFISIKENETIEEFIFNYIELKSAYRLLEATILYAPSIIGISKEWELDDDALQIVNEIKLKLNELKSSSQFFKIAPVLVRLIEETSKSSPKISRMVIDNDYRIILPDYQNREIRLPHLTKSLYFLFLKHPKGVYSKDFKIYKDELFEIYKKVSYRLDLDKMQESISELCKPDGSALRIHISRIKSAFAREFSDFYASKYYVIGGDSKNIMLDRKLLTWENDI